MNSLLNLDQFKDIVKKERPAYFLSTFDRAYKAFIELNYDTKDPLFFKNNASQIIENMCAQCWNDFLHEENHFTIEMMKKLIDTNEISNMHPQDAIEWFITNFNEHLYQLSLSNTQSRRSRAGKEFESIIELIILGANINLDCQGNIGKEYFINKNLGKLVDIVTPGVVHYSINKRNTILISAKTTLRERWQEVPEEMGRTGASEMFLATLDENISNDVLNTLYESNIQVTTTKRIKDKYYTNNSRVLTFEELIEICIDASNKWSDFIFTKNQLNTIISILTEQKDKHKNHLFVNDKFKERLLCYFNLLNKHD